MLTAEEIQLVQADWEKVEPIADTAATLFYDRLFMLDPSVRSLFKGDMNEQKQKLIRMIGAAIYGLTNPKQLVPIIRHLGHKHASFGVRNEHYATVGAALLWTLRQGLGSAFGPEHYTAWTKAYDVLAEVMKSGA